MRCPKIISTVLLLSLLFAPGCSYLESLFGEKKTRFTTAEIKRMIKDCEKDLPHRIDDNLTLTKITLDYGGTVNAWYTVSDELTAGLRRVGNVKIEEQMKKNIENIDLDSCGAPEELKTLFSQESFAMQYILEDKYGLQLASVVVSEETMNGDERVGRPQENPFAVRSVSKSGDK